ncbi:TetR family transcriptional regulator [Shewanella electrodiphila]|uniref:TetR family transcriptional regulator n=1 Tax=Shewanella electrodiphila TaxID=934143 RepID=A0ABT0KIU1_9GAMM|nr:TetR family transcriptional regulator [Shewanella electrodiphila]MCL1043762.1 TetR family transcriptional regulator [Shewanella electrodiphila]
MTTEQRLLNAAKELIKQHGVINFSMSDVPKACGLSRACCYQNFRDKNEILAALCIEEVQMNITAINEQRFEDFAMIFSMVLRPLIFNHLKDKDRLALEHIFAELTSLITLLPEKEEFKFLKRGFEFLDMEKKQNSI